jgi:diguanylate cyclase (GGDEF)-like protein/PAS domain S-box-containing protein
MNRSGSPCRFCHSPDAVPVQNLDLSWAMRCQACSAQGPSAADADQAWVAWAPSSHGEDLFRTVIDESPDIILMKDWDGRFLLGNRQLARLYGTTPEGLVGHDDGAFNPNQEQVAFYLENVRSIMRAGVTETVMESSTDVETGEVRHFQSVKKPLNGPDGRPRILVIAHDITDLKRAHEAIEERERSYAYAMDAAGEGIWDWDIRSNIVTHNVKWCELFGFEPHELAHPIEDFTGLLHPDDRAEVQQVLEEALTGSGSYQHEHRMARRDGTVLHVFDRGKVVERDEFGRATRMAGAVSDITARVHAEHRLRVTTEALIDANISLESKVEERTAELARANEGLRTLAWRDALTGLPNRLAGMERLTSEFARIKRSDVASSILMMDVDLFKPVNDTYGHGAGDDVLCHIATLIRQSLRVGDFVARFGGEEFMALLPDTDLAGATVVAEKIRTTIEQSPERTVGTVTISIGAALADSSDPDMDIAVRRADAALYDAKRSGRNRVVTLVRVDDLA